MDEYPDRKPLKWTLLFLTAILIAFVVLAVLTGPPHSFGAELAVAVEAPACTDYPGKREWRAICRLIRSVAGHELFRACIDAGKVCNGKAHR